MNFRTFFFLMLVAIMIIIPLTASGWESITDVEEDVPHGTHISVVEPEQKGATDILKEAFGNFCKESIHLIMTMD